ncbi:hypothetical protein HMPREF3214_01318 [Alloscardovia omnicolens]|uniref:Uncharacterized protein n=1 Tax=Alloscardovia omnicolens F0580 TaxID=1321816 RepID=U1R7R6_9BIFI|nr:hypothetical protein HMPREF9244_01334 [Alloscardovia omnicolens F0580]KWZ73545.1 hypothetical protein HMPREF3214_01318 [Alloscardovia omnicolens]
MLKDYIKFEENQKMFNILYKNRDNSKSLARFMRTIDCSLYEQKADE